jgi:hypothetical protein
MAIQTPWAILLCRWNGNDSTTAWGKSRYDDLFTAAGVGKFNLVDYFRDMSHGRLDLSGSQVFDWIPLKQKVTDYKGSGVNQQGRADLLAWAKESAAEQKINLGAFFNVVVLTNVSVDLFGGPDGVVCGDGRYDNGMTALSPSLIAQEMAHCYGLIGHSKIDGSEEPYKDRWDVMSTANAFMTPHPIFTETDSRANPIFLMGPGMNAANMYSLGWIDTARLFSADDDHIGTIQLRPLHRRDLPGYLLARIGQYFVEFRTPEFWDRAIDTPVVLVHEFFNGSSYIHAASNTYEGPTEAEPFHSYSDAIVRQGLIKGDYFQVGDPADPLGRFLRVSVLDISLNDHTATLHVYRRRDRHPKTGLQLELEGATTDAGGYVLVGGKLKKIPPWSPLYAVAESIVQAQESESITGKLRNVVQAEIYERISQTALAQIERLQSFGSPAQPRIVEHMPPLPGLAAERPRPP